MNWVLAALAIGGGIALWRFVETSLEHRFDPSSTTGGARPPSPSPAVAEDRPAPATEALPEAPEPTEQQAATTAAEPSQEPLQSTAPTEPPLSPAREESPTPAEDPGITALRARLAAGEAPDPEQVKALAAAPGTRASIYRILKKARKASLIPRKHRTQKAMAEADLATWLVTSRLGALPSRIEHVEVFTSEPASGSPQDWYMLRFKSEDADWQEKSWMVGVSGPWPRKQGPSALPGGDTGSSFARWASRTTDEHGDNIRALLERWEESRSS